MARYILLGVLCLVSLTAGYVRGAEPNRALNTQAETTKLLTAAEALSKIKVPEGFRATLFADESVVSQPIGIATDHRGRVWIAENNTYAESAVGFAADQLDRIVVLTDADNDGQADGHTVFWDQARKLTSVEIGLGGVWALCPPQLLFIPDRDGDDRPDGPPEVVLDGWNESDVRHNVVNGLRWGPDGWLYGRHGILSTSLIGAPGTSPAARTPVSCSIWRYHPTRKVFEVVCQGTTNPWGMDWDADGELFFINTVIGHLWHAVPGAHFRRMYGEDANPYVYRLMEQTADHVHWDTAEAWHDIRQIGVSPTTDQAGGGHAHSGLMIYQGENWPARYRDTMFTINFHGKRLNNDTIARDRSGYVGRHAADFLSTSDPWFRGIDLITGADGGVFITDWSDIGECHDNDGIHRTSGRIYKVVYGAAPTAKIPDVAKLDDKGLVHALFQNNEWLVRRARLRLQELAGERGASAELIDELRQRLDTDASPRHRLRALWALYGVGAANEDLLCRLLSQSDEHIRTWAVRLMTDGRAPTPKALQELTHLATGEKSGLVLLYLASALQQIAPAERWSLAGALAAHAELADDPSFPLMLWYGLEPSIPENPSRAVALAAASQVPLVTQLIARRLTENIRTVPEPVSELVGLAGLPQELSRRRAILLGMSEALRGWRKAPAPSTWSELITRLAEDRDEDNLPLARELSVVFGDGRALDEVKGVVADGKADPAVRREAIRVLVEAHAEGLLPLLSNLIADRDLGGDAVRGLATCDDPAVPALLLRQYANLRDSAREAAVVTLCSRSGWAMQLLDAIADGKIDRAQVPAFNVRQIAAAPDESLRQRVADLWPELQQVSAAKAERMASLKQALEPEVLAQADLSAGRKRFVTACATCHTLFGQGAKIGPDLTGSQRTNLDYLLENIVDPAATVTPVYRLSSVVLQDGRLLNGIVVDQGGPTLALQTPTERLVIERSEVEEIRPSKLSLMPEGALDLLTPDEQRDLIAYLMAPQQVPLPASTSN